jgi:hypothetical protein
MNQHSKKNSRMLSTEPRVWYFEEQLGFEAQLANGALGCWMIPRSKLTNQRRGFSLAKFAKYGQVHLSSRSKRPQGGAVSQLFCGFSPFWVDEKQRTWFFQFFFVKTSAKTSFKELPMTVSVPLVLEAYFLWLQALVVLGKPRQVHLFVIKSIPTCSRASNSLKFALSFLDKWMSHYESHYCSPRALWAAGCLPWPKSHFLRQPGHPGFPQSVRVDAELGADAQNQTKNYFYTV